MSLSSGHDRGFQASAAREKARADYDDSCQPLIDGEEDMFTWEQADPCWRACQEEFSIRLLSGWIGRWQSALQERLPAAPGRWIAAAYGRALDGLPGWAAALLPSGPLLLAAYLAAITMYCLLFVGVIKLTARLILKMPTGFSRCLTLLLAIFAILTLVVVSLVLHAWLSLVAWLCLLAASVSADPAATGEAVPWASAWMSTADSFRLPYLPLCIWLPILVAFMVKLARMLFKKQIQLKHSGRTTMWDLCAWIALCLSESVVILPVKLVVLIVHHMMEAGAPGPEWVCTKSFAGSVFGRLPPSLPYQVGGVYAALSIVHGLWLGSSKKANLPGRPNDTGDSFVSDATWSWLNLRVKFAGLGPGGWVQQVYFRSRCMPRQSSVSKRVGSDPFRGRAWGYVVHGL